MIEAPADADVAIRTRELTRRFGPITAVNGLSLEVPTGKIFGFLGPNGSGKTTTIRLLLGLLAPTSGRAEVLGHDTRSQGDAIRGVAGALLEHSGLYERLTAEENLELYARIWSLPASERRARVRELLTHFGLYERRDDVAGSWSKGMKQKLAVARTLIHRPALVFLDEPTAGLDPEAAVALRLDIEQLAAREGTTVFLTTHNLAEAEKVCHLVGLIRNGELRAYGPPGSLSPPREATPVEITGRNFGEDFLKRLRARVDVTAASLARGDLLVEVRKEADRAAIVRTIVEAGGEIEGMRERERSLEDVYLDLVGEAR